MVTVDSNFKLQRFGNVTETVSVRFLKAERGSHWTTPNCMAMRYVGSCGFGGVRTTPIVSRTYHIFETKSIGY